MPRKAAKRPAASRGAAGARKAKQGKKKRASGANATTMQDYNRLYSKRNERNPHRVAPPVRDPNKPR